MKKFLCLIVLTTIFASCSLVRSTALNVTSDLIADGSDELFTEGNYAYFTQATPGNLKLMEGLWYGDQKNEVLLTTLIKGHAGYTYGALETGAYSDILLDESSSSKEQAILGYEKAIFYGIKYLELKGITSSEFYHKDFALKIPQVFEQKMDKEDYPALFYFAQALGSSINLQRDNIAKMGHLGHVKQMLAWVCHKDPALENGNCGLFQAVIEASTPSVLGGSITKAKSLLQQVKEAYPENLLARLSYIQFYLVPMLEENEYQLEMEKLNKDLSHWYELQLGNKSKENERFANKRMFNLFNAIAKERYKILKKIEKEIF